MRQPFSFKSTEDQFHIFIDSPNSPVNVMTREGASQLVSILDQVDSSKHRCVLFFSNKPYSFLNGAELLLTQNIKGQEDIERLTMATRKAYEKVASLPVPTIAVLQGNTYGCGLEFSLCCDWRVAVDTYDTHFYMTELKDYHCLPIFGGLRKLPLLIGIEPAVDMLLRAKTNWPRKARELGLVDCVINADTPWHEAFEQLPFGGMKKRVWPQTSRLSWKEEDVAHYYKNISDEIDRLAPDKRSLYQQCFHSLLETLPESEKTKIPFIQEKNAKDFLFEQSSQNATSFFFIRTMARVAVLKTSSTLPEETVRLEERPETGRVELLSLLKERRLKGVEVVTHPELSFNTSQQNIFWLTHGKAGSSQPVKVIWGYQTLVEETGLLLYFPAKENLPICEARIPEDDLISTRSFLQYLSHLGWQVIAQVVSPKEKPTSSLNRFIDCYLTTVEQLLEKGQPLENLNHTLWIYGFDFLPAEIDRLFGKNRTSWESDLRKGKDDPLLLQAFLKPLYEEGQSQLKGKILKHSSQVDLVMRELFGYPLIRKNFSRAMEEMKGNR